eukprot:PLAT5265.1.p1 GENE.PLAT5265.1~~PLAT5265.1.p1  ORF type:complete len:513 (+),score=122.23 PLAT5265.1:97-1635(+)
MMSAEEEDKRDEHVSVASLGETEASGHVARRVPDDAWGVVVRFCASDDSMSLSSTCSWLREAVLGAIDFIHVKRTARIGFPAARFTSLQSISMSRTVQLVKLLPALRDCAQLRELDLYCQFQESTDAFIEHIPFFPRLQSLLLSWVTVDSRLGQALASCETLRDVKLTTGLHFDRSEGRTDFVGDFLRELAALSTLRSLVGIRICDEEDAAQLCTAVAAWPELQQLAVQSNPDKDGGRLLTAPRHGIAAAVCSSCPQIRKLSLLGIDFAQHVEVDDAEAIACMTELRELELSGYLPAASLVQLQALPKLQKLLLSKCEVDVDAGRQLAAVIAQLPLTSFTLSHVRLPVAAVGDVLACITTHGSLASVELLRTSLKPTATERQRLGAALGEAVCLSCVRHWTVYFQFSLLAFLRAWNGRTPAAAVTTLNLVWSDSTACEGEEYVALLRRCLHSCPSLKQVCLRNHTGIVASVVDAAAVERLTPAVLTLRCSYETRELYRGKRRQLRAAGLVLE